MELIWNFLKIWICSLNYYYTAKLLLFSCKEKLLGRHCFLHSYLHILSIVFSGYLYYRCSWYNLYSIIIFHTHNPTVHMHHTPHNSSSLICFQSHSSHPSCLSLHDIPSGINTICIHSFPFQISASALIVSVIKSVIKIM